MNIEDILASVDDHGTQSAFLDLQKLTRAWMAERSSPELLQWPATLMDRMLNKIKTQVDK